MWPMHFHFNLLVYKTCISSLILQLPSCIIVSTHYRTNFHYSSFGVFSHFHPLSYVNTWPHSSAVISWSNQFVLALPYSACTMSVTPGALCPLAHMSDPSPLQRPMLFRSSCVPSLFRVLLRAQSPSHGVIERQSVPHALNHFRCVYILEMQEVPV